MIAVVPSRDIALFNRLINHPDIAPHVRDDSTPDQPLDVSPLNTEQNVFLLVKADDEPTGFAIMVGLGNGMYEQHSGMLATHRGHHALRAGREVFRWMFCNTDCTTISTWAWSTAKHVLLMARALGFVEKTRARWNHTVNGIAVDRVVFECAKPI